MNYKHHYLSLLVTFCLVLNASQAFTQEVIDQVVAVVGNDKILLSDIEQEVLRMQMYGQTSDGDAKCEVFEDMLVHKLMLYQAQLDSLVTSDIAVETEMDRRLNYFIGQIGSEAALEKYFNKPMFRIRDDIRTVVRETQLTQQMRDKVVENVRITPNEVKRFFRNLHPDSIPIIPEQLEYRQIVLYPPASDEAKFLVREFLLELRERILKGERFSTLAVAYSEDRTSATRGGELGFRFREELVKSFADVAFNLKEGQVSQIVETEYGFHIIQLIERRGDQVNVRHILMRPTYTSDMVAKAYSKLDSISGLIRSDSITFQLAAMRFSEDQKTRLSGGMVINPRTGMTLFEREHVLPADHFIIRNLKVGEMSAPFESRDQHANVVYKIVMLTQVIPTHRANLKDDYAIIQRMAHAMKEEEVLMNWIEEKQKTTYVKIDPSFSNCQFEMKGWVK